MPFSVLLVNDARFTATFSLTKVRRPSVAQATACNSQSSQSQKMGAATLLAEFAPLARLAGVSPSRFGPKLNLFRRLSSEFVPAAPGGDW